MPRVRRRLFNLAATVSLVLCVATVALWMRSYWTSDFLLWRSRGYASVSLSACRGSVDLMRAHSTPDRFEFIRVPASQAVCPRWRAGATFSFNKLGCAFYKCPDIRYGWSEVGRGPVLY